MTFGHYLKHAVRYTTEAVRNKGVKSLKQYCMHCHGIVSNVICNCGILFILCSVIEYV